MSGKRTAAVLVLLSLSLLLLYVPAQAGADTAETTSPPFECEGPSSEELPDDRDELLNELRSMEGKAGLETFGEFELVRSEAVLDVQSGSFTATDRERNQNVVRVLRSFERAYACFEDERYEETLDRLNETTALNADFTGEQGTQYQSVIDLALSRLYENVGAELLQEAEQAESTPERIDTLSKATISFREAGATDRFSQLTVRLDELEREFERDMAQVDEAVQEGEQFVEACGDCTESSAALADLQYEVFETYTTAVTVSSELSEAQERLDEHQVESEAVETVNEAVTERRNTLALTGASILLGSSLVVAIVAGVVAQRLVQWKQDVTASTAGDLLLWGGIIND